jgi:hypothetical protein
MTRGATWGDGVALTTDFDEILAFRGWDFSLGLEALAKTFAFFFSGLDLKPLRSFPLDLLAMIHSTLVGSERQLIVEPAS